MIAQSESGELAVLPAHDADAVVVEKMAAEVDSACASGASCDSPLRGATKVVRDGGGNCTSAFVADSDTNSHIFMLTAGHCGNINDEFTIGGYDHFFQEATREAAAGTQDALAIRIQSTQAGDGRLYRDPGAKYHNVQWRAWNSTINQGDWVCTYSWRSFDRACGNIMVDSITLSGYDDQFRFRVHIPGIWQCTTGPWHLRIAGSSGAAVTSGGGATAIGILRGCGLRAYNQVEGTTRFWFSAGKIRNIEDELDVTVRTS